MNRKRLYQLLLIPMVAVLLYLIGRLLFANPAAPALAALEPLPLDGKQRLLILAPHCDDETLGAGGLILAARERGMDIRVVIETNGDGNTFSAMEDTRHLRLLSRDYILIGTQRQQESLRALSRLGVQSNQVIFLSYPDRGTPSLWEDNWLRTNPYRSRYNGETHSPYQITYDPSSLYAGEDLLHDLISIIQSYQPDLIIYPHPEDVHPDHWGLSAFFRLALALAQKSNPGYKPDAYAYLVHRPHFPSPEGLKPNLELLPPAVIYDLNPHWYSLDLTPEDINTKEQALFEYSSQLPRYNRALEGFIRRNEIFARVDPSPLVQLSSGSPYNPISWRDMNGHAVDPVVLDPVKDLTTRKTISSADLDATYLAEGPEKDLYACAAVRGKTSSELSYTVRILAIGADGSIHHWTENNHQTDPGGEKVLLQGSFACAHTSLEKLGNPWLIFLGADVQQNPGWKLDQAAWQMALTNGAGTLIGSGESYH